MREALKTSVGRYSQAINSAISIENVQGKGLQLVVRFANRKHYLPLSSAPLNADEHKNVKYNRYVRHIMNVGWNAVDANKDYLPLTGDDTEQSSLSGNNEKIAFVAPYNGFLEKIVVRSSEACGSSGVGFHKSSEGTEVPNLSATEEITVNMAADDTGYTFTFTNTSSFVKGDIITISFDPSNTPQDTVATIIWKFDTST